MKRKRAENIFSAMTDINEKYLEEAENYTAGSQTVTVHPGRKRWVAIAACFVLIMAVAFPALNNLFGKTASKASNDAAGFIQEAAQDGANANKSYSSEGDNACRVSSMPDDACGITWKVVGDAELSFDVTEFDLHNTECYITVLWTNNTSHDININPTFALLKEDENGKLVNALGEDVTMAFPTVIYTAEKDGGTTEITYPLPHLTELGSEKLVIFLNGTEETPYRIDIDLATS
ncbi:MAG: hypothetical protein IKT04_04865 [Clostridia bacterium]|nr:hypothetical protein [Clostridia bacterium]MBR6479815.1 hypothetical protein [Clostridia bacterium]MBR6512369.1 hypothetical protein [Clostridia bacterium]